MHKRILASCVTPGCETISLKRLLKSCHHGVHVGVSSPKLRPVCSDQSEGIILRVARDRRRSQLLPECTAAAFILDRDEYEGGSTLPRPRFMEGGNSAGTHDQSMESQRESRADSVNTHVMAWMEIWEEEHGDSLLAEAGRILDLMLNPAGASDSPQQRQL